MTTHKEWLDNEYRSWIEALEQSTPYNFKNHPQVRRMLSEDLAFPDSLKELLAPKELSLIYKIDRIGRDSDGITDACWRMVYYARKILELNPPSVIEIGGGVGEFYAVLRALGYKGAYFIHDLPEVMAFQRAYLRAVRYETGLFTEQSLRFDFCVSFYALGEFDDEAKAWCMELIVNKCPHGLIVWNPHSGASEEIPFECDVQIQYDGSKLLTW